VVWTDFTLYMDSAKYIGMDVHKETISIAVRNSCGKLVMESDKQGSRAGYESAQSLVWELGHSLRGDASLRTALPFGMVEQDYQLEHWGGNLSG